MRRLKRTTSVLRWFKAAENLQSCFSCWISLPVRQDYFFLDVLLSLATQWCSCQPCYLTAQVAGLIPISVWILRRSFSFCTWVPHSWWWVRLWWVWTLFWILTRVSPGLKPTWGFGRLMVSIFVPNLVSVWTDSWLKGWHIRQSSALDNMALVKAGFKLGYSN